MDLVGHVRVFNTFLKKFYTRNAAYISEMEEAMTASAEPNNNEAAVDDLFYYGLSELYIDFLNIVLVITGVRNGTQTERIADFFTEEMLADFQTELVVTYPHLDARQFKAERPLIVWNRERITEAELAHSWAAEGNMNRANNIAYFRNTARLLGTPVGYPSYTNNVAIRGDWNLEVTFAFQDGEITQMGSLCGGVFRADIQDDLRAVPFIKHNVEQILHQKFYHPSIDVEMSGIEEKITYPVGQKRRRMRGGRTRRRRLRSVKRTHRSRRRRL
jgi:hypothetical protein